MHGCMEEACRHDEVSSLSCRHLLFLGAGNYSEYERNTHEKLQHMLHMQEGIDKKRAHANKSIQVYPEVWPTIIFI